MSKKRCIALDTSVMYQLLRQKPHELDADAWRQAHALWKRADLFDFCVAAPAWGETLAFTKSPDRRKQIAEHLQRKPLAVLAYDERAAALAGHLWSIRKKRPQGGWSPLVRHAIKIDCEIAACVARWQVVDGLCSFDNGFRGMLADLGGKLDVGTPLHFLPTQDHSPASR